MARWQIIVDIPDDRGLEPFNLPNKLYQIVWGELNGRVVGVVREPEERQ